MAELLPRLSLDLAQPLAGTGERRWLEIGFGGGEHLAQQAALHPDVTLIGAEAFQNGVAKLLALAEERGLANLRIHYGDARDLLSSLPDYCLERVYLLYPDPWPKERQKKRRFVNDANLAEIDRALKDDGRFFFASDIPDYVAWTREHVSRSGRFAETGDAAEPFDDWTVTRYEAKALREGRRPAYLRFDKRPVFRASDESV
jgi:tRNA (guanine-N7-)-methyltransferase